MNHWMNVKVSYGYRSSLVYFCLAAIFGLVLRLAFSVNLPDWISFPNVRHAHSHVALLGWLFAGYFLTITHVFDWKWGTFKSLFLGLQLTVAGMALTFPVTGYAALSIAVSGIHIMLSYIMIWRFWRASTQLTSGVISKYFLRASLVFLFLASLGVWSLGPLMMSSWKGTAVYYGAIQWYLHFMFNGWMIFALMAIAYRYLEKKEISFDIGYAKRAFSTLTLSTLLTFALAVTWSTPLDLMFYINSLGVILQLLALYLLWSSVRHVANQVLSQLPAQGRVLLKISIIALVLKIIIQTAVVFPFIAKISYTIKHFTVGFIHLLMLGCLSTFVLAYIRSELNYRFSQKAALLFIGAIIATELLLFGQGLLLWLGKGFISLYYHSMTLFSLLLAISILCITASLKTNSHEIGHKDA